MEGRLFAGWLRYIFVQAFLHQGKESLTPPIRAANTIWSFIMVQDLVPWFHALLLVLQGVADMCTAILGLFGVYQLLVNRKKIKEHFAQFTTLLRALRTTSSVTQVRTTLTKLRQKDYDRPDDRPGVKNLMAELAGQLSFLVERNEELRKQHTVVVNLLSAWKGFTEVKKLHIISTIEVQLDNVAHDASEGLIKPQ